MADLDWEKPIWKHAAYTKAHMFSKVTKMTSEYLTQINLCGLVSVSQACHPRPDTVILWTFLEAILSCSAAGLKHRATEISTSWRNKIVNTSRFGALRRCVGSKVNTSETHQPRDMAIQVQPLAPISWSLEDGNSQRPLIKSLFWEN